MSVKRDFRFRFVGSVVAPKAGDDLVFFGASGHNTRFKSNNLSLTSCEL